MFWIRARARPCSARVVLSSSPRMTETLPPSTLTLTRGGICSVSVPLGPFTRTPPSTVSTLTPFGIGIGLRPTRDMALPHLAEELAAHRSRPRLAVRQHTLRGGDHRDAEPAAHLGDLVAGDIDPAPRTAHPAQARDQGAPGSVVAHAHHQHVLAVALLHAHLAQIALGGEHLGDRMPQPRGGAHDLGVVRLARVADAGQQVGDRIGHHARVPSYCRNGTPRCASSARPSASLRAVVQTVMFMPVTRSTLSNTISGKMICSRTPSEKLPRPSKALSERPLKSRTRGSETLTSRSKNSHIRSRRSVTVQPTDWPSRSLKLAIDLRAFRITGFCPVMAASSSAAFSSSFGLAVASPRPMLTTILVSLGT